MRTLINSLLVIVFSVSILFSGCSKKAIKKSSKTNNNKKQAETNTVKKTHDAIKNSQEVNNKKKTTNKLTSERITEIVPRENLTSIKKSDKQLKKEASAVQERLAELQKVYFDYDRSDIRADGKDILTDNADILSNKDETDVLIEGYCDERGTEEYNLALGQRRAESVKKYLASLGISSARMTTISYGESRPEVLESNESAWSKNRRAVLKEIK